MSPRNVSSYAVRALVALSFAACSTSTSAGASDADDTAGGSSDALSDGVDATDAVDGSVGTDGSDSTDSGDGADSIDGTDEGDSTGADGSDVGADGVDGLDGSDAVADGTDGTDGTSSGACTSAPDMVAFEGEGFFVAVDTCMVDCNGEKECLTTCISAATSISSGCSVCLAEASACTFEVCGGCTQDECACDRTECEIGFAECSGLSGFGDDGGPTDGLDGPQIGRAHV